MKEAAREKCISFLPRWLVASPSSSGSPSSSEETRSSLLRLLSSLLDESVDEKTNDALKRRCADGVRSIERHLPMFAKAFGEEVDDDDDDDDDALLRKLVELQHAKDFVWEELHTGDWKDVEEKWREGEGVTVFAYCRCVMRYARGRLKRGEIMVNYVEGVLRNVIKELDVGVLLAGDVGGGKDLARVAEEVSERLKEVMKLNMNGTKETKSVLDWRFEYDHVENVNEEDKDVKEDDKKRKRDEREEKEEKNVLFPILEKDKGGRPPLKVPAFKELLSLEKFLTDFYVPMKPCVIRRFCTHWPAYEKWKDPLYFLDNFGARAVPVEFGNSYSNDNWRIKVVTFEEFLSKHMTDDESGAYLAQQTLADQFPKLLEDILEPDYVHGCIREEEGGRESNNKKEHGGSCVAKNFWIGPKNTISPPHTDPRDNLFVQICGAKCIRLWKPLHTDTAADDDGVDDNNENNSNKENKSGIILTTTMYPYTPSSLENNKLTNTSKAEDISLSSCPRKFPKLYRRPFYDVHLNAGDMLFIPRGWWHFVKSLSNSISVSYWW